MAHLVRKLVSKKKRRFEWGEFDLDLSYITDRIVAMGFPSESLEGLYRNNMKDVQKFLDSLHPGRYKVYNLCSENNYDHQKFQGMVEEFPFDDHNSPPLEMIPRFCKSVDEWLNKHPENMVAIHCKAGKGRTGTMISCYLIYCGYCPSWQEATRLFGNKRTINGKGVTIPSQFRYVQYFDQLLKKSDTFELPPSNPLLLTRILMHSVPDFNIGGGCEPFIVISQKKRSVYFSKPIKLKKGNEIIEFDCGNVLLCDDIRVEFFNANTKGKMFSFNVHTSFVQNNYLHLRRMELDKANKDTQHKHFALGFQIEMFFQTPKPDNASSVITSQTLQIASEIPRCEKCQEIITQDKASVTYGQQQWCWDCLVCSVCSQAVRDDVLFNDKGEVICSSCQKGKGFFKFCAECGLVIKSDQHEEIGELAWHTDCFVCDFCRRIVGRGEYILEKNKPVCSLCRDVANLSKPASDVPSSPPKGSDSCPGCNKSVHLTQPRSLALGKCWHRDCFVCANCKAPFSDSRFFINNDQPYCAQCDQSIRDAMAPACGGCRLPITDSEMTEALEKTWHLSCFSCEHCKIQIAGAFGEKEGKVYCKDDFENLFSTKCDECGKVIVGPFLRAFEKAFHPSCFVCSQCKAVLVNGQYYEIDNKAICPTCKERDDEEELKKEINDSRIDDSAVTNNNNSTSPTTQKRTSPTTNPDQKPMMGSRGNPLLGNRGQEPKSNSESSNNNNNNNHNNNHSSKIQIGSSANSSWNAWGSNPSEHRRPPRTTEKKPLLCEHRNSVTFTTRRLSRAEKPDILAMYLIGQQQASAAVPISTPAKEISLGSSRLPQQSSSLPKQYVFQNHNNQNSNGNGQNHNSPTQNSDSHISPPNTGSSSTSSSTTSTIFPRSNSRSNINADPMSGDDPLEEDEGNEGVSQCTLCNKPFSFFNRKHYCRSCNQTICDDCSKGRCPVPVHQNVITKPQRVCDPCYKKNPWTWIESRNEI
eukprot:TRINITY_DN5479_c0_g1_i1.p1 TRINITY_DN5479_c0_g1~~TRINITY_DN5479_c0_g1_i1.p1  ORF type:complete len:980 (+),score=160.32 TRINITY_DN5479_c0_g1_i1:775-3714(+)